MSFQNALEFPEPSLHTIVPDQIPAEADELPSVVDRRNSLNDLTGSQWLPETKSFFFQKGLGATHPHAAIERQHPAPFSYQDIERLVKFFTKPNDVVLDPFAGVGSTAKACALQNRRSVNVELSEKWIALARERLQVEAGTDPGTAHQFVLGDSRTIVRKLRENCIDFVVTSPPYWAILNKKADHKALERVRLALATTYSDDDRDLGNVGEYGDFLDQLVTVFQSCGRALKAQHYMAIVVSDFRHKARFYSLHSDLIQRLSDIRICSGATLDLQGVKVLLQNHKSLKPYGYPFAYVENVHHQYILIFRKRAT